MITFSLQELLMRVLAGLLIIGLHGYAQAWVALRLGDSTPKDDGRVSPNPFSHLSWLGLIAFVVGLKGWGKPVQLDLERFPQPSRLVWVSLAGWVSCFLLALVATLLRPLVLNALSGDLSFTLVAFLSLLASGSIWFLVFNLIPLPPLDGFGIVAAIRPGLYRVSALLAYEIALLIFVALGWAETLLKPLYETLYGLLG